MKHISRTIIAVLMAVLMGTLLPFQVFAAAPDYISEIKIFAGDYSAAASEGYTLLKDGGKPVDLNQKAGGGLGSKGDKAVYLGYKTTKDKDEAVTDLALMNMKGGYDVAEYEKLMESQLKSQIQPFIVNFRSAILEYRQNYISNNELNKERANYVHDALNKLYDDDTGMPLGDLLLNKTKEELGDAAYNALSADEKKEHADLTTILAQSNGQATLIMESLITRAADTNDTTWIERFTGITYNDLVKSTGKSPTDAAKVLAKLYDDDAQEILAMWEDFKKHLDDYDTAVEMLEEENAKDFTEKEAFLESYEPKTATDDEIEKFAAYTEEIQTHTDIVSNCQIDVFLYEYLDSVNYGDGTLLDFFTREYDEVADEIELLYPLVASLTKGQRAGLDFVMLQDLVMFAASDEEGYRKKEFDDLQLTSIYLGVDREIYGKGGIALTSDALRKKVTEVETPDQSIALHIFAGIAATLAVASVVTLAVSASIRNTALKQLAQYNAKIAQLNKTINTSFSSLKGLGIMFKDNREVFGTAECEEIYGKTLLKHNNMIEDAREELARIKNPEYAARLEARSINCRRMMIGSTVVAVVMVALTAYLVYLDYQAMKEYYKVDFTPIPHYIVEEKDLISYNRKGEKTVLNNQSAYYKAVECNRTESDEFYKMLGTCADMNGDVGQQWLALYAVKYKVMEPILASSLKVVVGSAAIPAGYETGIHMFGADVAFNLNSSLYDWANDAPGVYVYFKTDDAAVSTAGTNFSGGTLALTGGAGIALGAVVTALAMNTAKKKKGNKAVSA